MPRPTLVVELSHSVPEAHSSPATTRRETPTKATRKSVGKSTKPKLPQIFATTRVSAHLPRSQQHFHVVRGANAATQIHKQRQKQTQKQTQKQITLQPVWRSAVFRKTDGKQLREREKESGHLCKSSRAYRTACKLTFL